MRIRCECGREFLTRDHDRTISFAPEAVVGPLGPDEVRNVVELSEAHACPHCGKGRYFAVVLELTHLTAEDLEEIERFMLRFYDRGGRATSA
jgi:hypothetical protein